MLITIAMVLLASSAQGTVVLNEIMYNPDGNTLGLDEQMEWVEICNASGTETNLAGMMLSDGNNQLYMGDFLLPPGGYGVLALDEQAFSSAYGGNILLIPWSGEWTNMRNSADELILYSADGTVLESLRYSDNWGAEGVNQSRADGDGASLERVDLFGTDDSTNWKPSEDFDCPVRDAAGDPVCWGTPGAENSVSDN